MRFTEDFMDEIKARTRVSDIVGRHVKLKRQGREFAGLSPFTNEKSPSFFVNDEKGFYHCFSSGKHGDSISFMMEVEGLSFPEAVERLAGMAGVSMPAEDPDAARKAAQSKKLINWTEEASRFFQQSLRRNVGADARRYLEGRGLGEADWARFGIGFAPDSFDALKNELINKDAPMQALVDTGLLIEPEDRDRQPWDRFRNRIMFPITDSRGRLIAFGGRAMAADAKAKYLNSPETQLFHKGSVLYRYPEARKALSDPKNPARGLIVAEGYMDVIALARAGFDHAVAPLGTALTENQMGLLWRAGPEPILCFDGDKAGLRAAFRSIERALPLIKPGQTLRFALMPDGLDPDDLIREQGASAMRKALDDALPLVDMLWRRELEKEDLSTPEAKAGLKDRIYAALREIGHEGVREQYKTALLGRFYKEYGRTNVQSIFSKTKPRESAKPETKRTRLNGEVRASLEKRILGTILHEPELLERYSDVFFEILFEVPNFKAIQDEVFRYFNPGIVGDRYSLAEHLNRAGLSRQIKSLHSSNISGSIHNFVAVSDGSDESLSLSSLWLTDVSNHELVGSSEALQKEFRARVRPIIQAGDSQAMVRLMRSYASSKKRHPKV